MLLYQISQEDLEHLATSLAIKLVSVMYQVKQLC